MIDRRIGISEALNQLAAGLMLQNSKIQIYTITGSGRLYFQSRNQINISIETHLQN